MSTLSSKLILILFLARLLPANELGMFTLVSTSIGYLIYIVGLELYTYTNRELIKETKNPEFILKNQFFTYLVAYAIIICFFYFFNLVTKTISLKIFFLAALLLFLEHLSQEFYRIYISLSKQNLASFILFIRSALWIFLAIPIISINSSLRSVEVILAFWIFGSFFSCLISIYYMSKIINQWSQKIDYDWLRKGILVALPFLISTLATKALFTIDKYWLAYLTNLDTVAAYAIYLSISMAIVAFLDASVFSFIYAEIIKSKKSPTDFRKNFRKLIKQTTIVTIPCILILMLITHPLIQFINKPIYLESIWMLPWSLAVAFFSILGLIPQYALYALEKDNHITASNIISFLVFLIITFLLSSSHPQEAVLVGLLSSTIFSAITKIISLVLISPRDYL